jgi:GMP synthase-like glutamine amidotransferase
LNSNKKLKYLGICFGAQLLTYSLGGKVGKSRKVHSGMLNMEVISNKRKNVPFSQFK